MKFVLITVLFFASAFDVCLAMEARPASCASEDCFQVEAFDAIDFSHSQGSEHCSHEYCKICHSCSTGLPITTYVEISIQITTLQYGFYEFGYTGPFFQRLKRPPKITV